MTTMNRTWLATPFLLLVSCGAWANADEFARLGLNQIQVIGSHNSFKTAIDPGLLELIGRFDQNHAKALDYSHATLTEQLDLGLRGLELDVYHDPEGGRYAYPFGRWLQQNAGYELLPYDAEVIRQPGFKVMHTQDLDFRSNCPLLRDAYRELRKWSESHSQHLPIVITFNAKSGPSVLPGGVSALEFDDSALQAWEELTLAELGRERLLTPADVQGNFATLEQAVLTNGWPKLADCRGKVLLVLDEQGPVRERYLRGTNSAGRVMFTTSPPGDPDAAFLIINDPIAEKSQILERVRQGYMVRTRADADTWEARRSDLRRFHAAAEAGAQIISTDFYSVNPAVSPTYVVRWGDSQYQRRNLVTASSTSD